MASDFLLVQNVSASTKQKVFALHLFDQTMVGKVDNVSYELMEIIADARVNLISKEMNVA
ncbi:hypothetical protein [Vibrio campbellii]|uniref:hypothetical protein n=1 Tax=Vibrio campbellii TaxID=680 RepID=UPI0002AE6AF5|nr:hypothetical protein [Vibrio campbellii]ARV72761.1 hypothetical protein A8140_08530 [Vibrio campbellii CAIM 519 = NBRC 15631 = ATCC 25920]ELU50353.1 aspartate kinase [Vibrio campbellii CAIM 519 = NBRC 15631 = ATCC 25920]